MELINGKTALFATAIYLVIAAIIFIKLEKGKKTLSIIGAYWGGILSPIPLIWLTLGYFSQLEDSREYKSFIKNQTITNNINIDFIKRQSEISEQRSKPNFIFLNATKNNDESITLEFLNSGAPISGFQVLGRSNTYVIFNDWNRSEAKKITLKSIEEIKFMDNKEISRVVRFTNIYGFEKEYTLIFKRKANLLYIDKIGEHYGEPIDTALILPINE